jgi:23S rRNA (guanine745-N1)-methyltransferase
VLEDVVGCLACPHCGANLSLTESALRCPTGHTFDIARQGYAGLLPGNAHIGTADTARMVAAREAFLAAGHYAGIAGAVSDATARALADAGPGCIVEVGTGTGYYLAFVLERLPERFGVALDISKYALRRAARAHSRIGAVAADVWRGLPLRTGSAAAVLDVFAPRNVGEFHRVLTPDGVLVLATPDPGHLTELVEALGLLDVDASKRERIAASVSGSFERIDLTPVEAFIELTRDEVAAVVAMGPSAYHVDPADLAERIAALKEPVRTRLAVTVSVYRPVP